MESSDIARENARKARHNIALAKWRAANLDKARAINLKARKKYTAKLLESWRAVQVATSADVQTTTSTSGDDVKPQQKA